MANDLNQTPSANRIHIGFFGRRNAGKSSLVNAVTGQDLSIVSEVRGTTTDPVNKAMELLPLGPVVIIDTPGIDDEGDLGALRVNRAYRILNKTDIAVLVVDAASGMQPEDRAMLKKIQDKKIPHVVVYNKSDLAGPAGEEKPRSAAETAGDGPEAVISVSALTGANIRELKEMIAAQAKHLGNENRIISDLLSPGQVVILVTPIDESAPKGRMILPQVQTIRDILDVHAAPLVTQVEELPAMLASLKEPPFAVVTDSQAFESVKKMVPESIHLTSFSILMARYKGILEIAAPGAFALSRLQDGDTVLVCEGCTHHRQCEDIGTVKLPGWINSFTGKKLTYVFTSGMEYPEDLSPYALVVHCGGCMLNEREMRYRMKCAQDQQVPFTNYGTLIAHINGILQRSLSLLPSIQGSVRK